MAQLESNTLLLVNVADGDGANATQNYIDTNYDTVLKFYTRDEETSNLVYSYIPSTLEATLKYKNDFIDNIVKTGTLSLYYTYRVGKDVLQSETFEFIRGLSFRLDTAEFSNIDLQTIVIEGNIEGCVPIKKIFQVVYGTTDDMAKLSLEAANIFASIGDTKLNFSTSGLLIQNGNFEIRNENNKPIFYTDSNGNLTLSGNLISSGGTIGGWTINDFGLYKEKIDDLTDVSLKVAGLYGGDEFYYLDYSKSPIRFWAGQNQVEQIIEDKKYLSSNFAVTNDGSLFAKKADIEGTIYATDGLITNTFLVGNDGIVLYGGEHEDSYIASSSYISGQQGYGWKLFQDGSAEFENITARGKIQSSVFEYNKISSIGGSLYIAPTIYIETESNIFSFPEESAQNNDASHLTTFYVSWNLPYETSDINGHKWVIDDRVKIDGYILKDNGECLELSNLNGIINTIVSEDETTTITIQTSVEYSKKDLQGCHFQPGVVLILHGDSETNQGIYLTAMEQNSPYIDVYDRNENTPAVRLGNLKGISDGSFPGSALEGYGLYSTNAYLKGQLMLPSAGITDQEKIKYNDSAIRIWAGYDPETDINKDITQANFIVTADGSMYANKGVFKGSVIADNSEFSGTIRAAGIVVEKGADGFNPIGGKDHFFVAYKDQPENFNDYVLDIGQHGLSIWEGALRAYSDYASGVTKDNSNFIPIYGYNNENQNPQPYFFLVDDGEGDKLNSRVVAYKGHFFTIEKNGNNFDTNSVIIDNGINFSIRKDISNLDSIESVAYYSNFLSSINQDDFALNIQSKNNIIISTQNTIIFSDEERLHEEHSEKMVVFGQVKILNEIDDNILLLNNVGIKEAKKEIQLDNGTIREETIGIDFIINRG